MCRHFNQRRALPSAGICDLTHFQTQALFGCGKWENKEQILETLVKKDNGDIVTLYEIIPTGSVAPDPNQTVRERGSDRSMDKDLSELDFALPAPPSKEEATITILKRQIRDKSRNIRWLILFNVILLAYGIYITFKK